MYRLTPEMNETKRRILLQTAEYFAEQEGGAPHVEGGEEFPGSKACWDIFTSLRKANEPENKEENQDQSIREMLPCKPKAAQPVEQPSRFKWKTSLDEKFEFDFATSSPCDSIERIPWESSVKGVERSSSGSEGVFFVGFHGTPEAVVVKGSRNIAAETFAGLLAVKLGLETPVFRIISINAREAQSMLRAFRDSDPLGLAHTVLSKQGFLLLKNFVRGVDLSNIKEKDLQNIFGKIQDIGVSAQGQARFRELAKLLLLDVLCNNGDRFPLIWDNRGNPGNIMFARSDGQIIAIDNAICSLSEENFPEQRQEYLDKVEKLIQFTKRHTDEGTESPQFHRVRDKMIEYCNYDYTEQGSLALQRAFLDEVFSCEENFLQEDQLAEWHSALSSFDPPLVGLHNVNISFVVDIWQTMRQSAGV